MLILGVWGLLALSSLGDAPLVDPEWVWVCVCLFVGVRWGSVLKLILCSCQPLVFPGSTCCNLEQVPVCCACGHPVGSISPLWLFPSQTKMNKRKISTQVSLEAPVLPLREPGRRGGQESQTRSRS